MRILGNYEVHWKMSSTVVLGFDPVTCFFIFDVYNATQTHQALVDETKTLKFFSKQIEPSKFFFEAKRRKRNLLKPKTPTATTTHLTI